MAKRHPAKADHTAKTNDSTRARRENVETPVGDYSGGAEVVSGDQGERLITAKELSGRIGFSVRRVREYTARGKIPAVRLNRRDLRFHWPSVLRKLAGH